MANQPIIRFEDVQKSYLGKQPIFSGINLTIQQGEFLFLTGVSGAGKSTIFKLIHGLETPDKGTVQFNGTDVHKLSAKEVPLHRRTIGMVFQDYKLLEQKSAWENIAVPLRIAGAASGVIDVKVKRIATRLKIQPLLDQKVCSLSGGEQQLVAIARAAVTEPLVILADEPTANLDLKMGQKIMDILLELNTNQRMTIVIATHDIQLIKSTERRTLLLKNAALFEVRSL